MAAAWSALAAEGQRVAVDMAFHPDVFGPLPAVSAPDLDIAIWGDPSLPGLETVLAVAAMDEENTVALNPSGAVRDPGLLAPVAGDLSAPETI